MQPLPDIAKERATILVVDDILPNQKLLRETLEPEGYEVLIASDGTTALEVTHAAHPDVILLDVQMPGLNGFETCRRLKDHDATRNLPVIFITANDDHDSLNEGFRAGAVDFVRKPFRREEVLLRVETHLKIHRLARSLAQKNHELQVSLQQTEEAKQRSDELLHVILPHDIAAELKATQRVEPRELKSVAVLFCDVVGFTAYCGDHDAREVHLNLQLLIEGFESIAASYGLEKIKTIGDCFLAIAQPSSPADDPAQAAVQCGLALIHAAQSQPPHWNVRAGVHVGPISAGVVGHRKYQFDIWGDTVNMAKRMQEAALPGTVCVMSAIGPTQTTLCRESYRGKTDVKGKGEIELMFLEPAGVETGK